MGVGSELATRSGRRFVSLSGSFIVCGGSFFPALLLAFGRAEAVDVGVFRVFVRRGFDGAGWKEGAFDASFMLRPFLIEREYDASIPASIFIGSEMRSTLSRAFENAVLLFSRENQDVRIILRAGSAWMSRSVRMKKHELYVISAVCLLHRASVVPESQLLHSSYGEALTEMLNNCKRKRSVEFILEQQA